MTDLRDTIHTAAISADNQVYLDYHGNTPWAQAKVAAGLRLNPEAVAYMRRELEDVALRKKLYEEQLAKDLGTSGKGKDDEHEKGSHAGKDEPHAQNSADVQRRGQPDDAGNGADLQRAPGEGSSSQSGGGRDSQGEQSPSADLPADSAAGPAASDS